VCGANNKHQEMTRMSEEDVIDAMLSAKPLMNFSIYTQSQADALLRMKGEIEEAMDGWSTTISDFPRSMISSGSGPWVHTRFCEQWTRMRRASPHPWRQKSG
jgi:hypothetical protein